MSSNIVSVDVGEVDSVDSVDEVDSVTDPSAREYTYKSIIELLPEIIYNRDFELFKKLYDILIFLDDEIYNEDEDLEYLKMIPKEEWTHDPFNLQKSELLTYASESGAHKITKLLLQDTNVNPSINNNKALSIAIEEGDITITKLLLEHPKVISKLYKKPLTFEKTKHNTETLKLFLSKTKPVNENSNSN